MTTMWMPLPYSDCQGMIDWINRVGQPAPCWRSITLNGIVHTEPFIQHIVDSLIHPLFASNYFQEIRMEAEIQTQVIPAGKITQFLLYIHQPFDSYTV